MSDDDDEVKGKGGGKSKAKGPKLQRAGSSAFKDLTKDSVEDGVGALFDVGSRLIAAIKGVSDVCALTVH